MKLSEYLRSSSSSDDPIRIIIRTSAVGSLRSEYGEIKLLSRINTEKDVLYHIQYTSDYCGHKTGATHIVDESWCANYEVIKIFQ